MKKILYRAGNAMRLDPGALFWLEAGMIWPVILSFDATLRFEPGFVTEKFWHNYLKTAWAVWPRRVFIIGIAILFLCSLAEFCWHYINYPVFVGKKTFLNHREKYDAARNRYFRYHSWIKEEMEKENLGWIIIYGKTVIGKSRQLYDFPEDEKLLRLAEKFGVVPFAYGYAFRIPDKTWK